MEAVVTLSKFFLFNLILKILDFLRQTKRKVWLNEDLVP